MSILCNSLGTQQDEDRFQRKNLFIWFILGQIGPHLDENMSYRFLLAYPLVKSEFY
jgi:hypothetical protein